MGTNFFADALRQAMAIRHFNQAQLAEFLRVDPAYVSRWLKGSSPRLDQMRNVLNLLGWNLERARPDYDPFDAALSQLDSDAAPEGKAVKEKGKGYKDMGEIRSLLRSAAEAHKAAALPAVEFIGNLESDTGRVIPPAKSERLSFESVSSLFPQFPYTDSSLSIITVKGPALGSDRPDGTRLAVRRIVKPSDVPEGSEVLFDSHNRPGDLILRRIYRIIEGDRVDRIVGAPLSPAQEFLSYKPRELKLYGLIVGSIQTTGPR